MLKYIHLFVLAITVAMQGPSAQAASRVETTESSAELISELGTIVPGQPFYAAVKIDLKPGWHTYWRNPGDAGLAPSLTWTLTRASAGAIEWPAPQRIKEGPLVTYSYVGQVLLPVRIAPDQTLAPGENLTLAVKAEWLACEQSCIPQSADLDLVVTAGEAAVDSPYKGLITRTLAQLPTRPAANAGMSVAAREITLSLPWNGEVRDAYFYPVAERVTEYGQPQRFAVSNGTLTLTMARQNEGDALDPLEGVLTVVTGENTVKSMEVVASASGAPVPAAVPAPALVATPDMAPAPIAAPETETPAPVTTITEAPPQEPPLATPIPPQKRHLLPMMLFALLGGLILNLMPCVFPVLSLKALALARHAGAHPAHARAEGLSYTAGVLASFLFLAAILLSLKAGGSAIGWGFQMQSPAFVAALAFLMFAVGLNLSGLFELPVLLGRVGAEVTREESLRGSFLTGVLAVAVAAPCTAPFMATALGYALSQPAGVALLMFATLGLGMALPFLLIGFFPQLVSFLPKPGAWMQNLRELLAFPMYAAAVWLLWVLGRQTGPDPVALTLLGMVIMAFGVWLCRPSAHPTPVRRTLTLLLAVGFPLLIVGLIRPDAQSPKLVQMDSVPYSASRLEELRAQKRPVFVDATAAWCITCQVNHRVALSTQRVKDAFAEKGVVMMVADWTRADPEITRFLESFGYRGVPLYVYFPPSGPPRVLPQLLSESIVLEALNQP